MCHPDSLTKTAKFVKWLEARSLVVIVMCVLTTTAFMLNDYVFETPAWYFIAGFITCEYDAYRKKI